MCGDVRSIEDCVDRKENYSFYSIFVCTNHTGREKDMLLTTMK